MNDFSHPEKMTENKPLISKLKAKKIVASQPSISIEKRREQIAVSLGRKNKADALISV